MEDRHSMVDSPDTGSRRMAAISQKANLRDEYFDVREAGPQSNDIQRYAFDYFALTKLKVFLDCL